MVFIIASCAKSHSIKSTGELSLNELFNAYWDEHAKLFPLEATSQGDYRFNHLLVNDQTENFRQELKSYYQKYLDQLLRFEREELSVDEKVSFDVFKYEMETQLKSLEFPFWKIPFQQFWGLPLTFAQLGSGESFQPFKTIKDYNDWLERMRSFSAWADSAIENFKQGVDSGIVLPKVLVKKMLPQLEDVVAKDVEKSLFYKPLQKMPDSFSVSEKNRLTKEFKLAIEEHINPSYQKLAYYLQNDYLPKARNSHGITAVQGGREYYNFLVKTWTTTEKSPDEIYQIGLSEVARIKKEMERVKRQVRFRGDLQKFFAHLKTSPKLMPYKKPDDVLEAFRSVQQKIAPRLKNMFSKVPKTAFEVRQTEEFRAESASAEYQPGSPDGSRPGIFYVPILDAKKFNITSGMESLFLHEAIPGHHYQVSLQQENEQLPQFRRFSWYGAYGEGWALYTESLGKELGLYTDPYQYMGALGDEMMRAVRLVVDVGLHIKGWTREKAIKYMMDHFPVSEEGAVAEVERYMAVPGQALSYKIGALKIRELRAKYEKKMKGKFNLAEFHDEFLREGCLPLSVIESKLDSWSNQ